MKDKKIRVSELAKDFGVSSKVLSTFLYDVHVEVSTASSTLEPILVDVLRDKWGRHDRTPVDMESINRRIEERRRYERLNRPPKVVREDIGRMMRITTSYGQPMRVRVLDHANSQVYCELPDGSRHWYPVSRIIRDDK